MTSFATKATQFAILLTSTFTYVLGIDFSATFFRTSTQLLFGRSHITMLNSASSKAQWQNIFLVDMIICNILILFIAAVGIVYFFWPKKSVCYLYYDSIIGLFISLSIFNMLLARVAQHRFVANKFRLWHRQKSLPKESFWFLVWVFYFQLNDSTSAVLCCSAVKCISATV